MWPSWPTNQIWKRTVPKSSDFKATESTDRGFGCFKILQFSWVAIALLIATLCNQFEIGHGWFHIIYVSISFDCKCKTCVSVRAFILNDSLFFSFGIDKSDAPSFASSHFQIQAKKNIKSYHQYLDSDYHRHDEMISRNRTLLRRKKISKKKQITSTNESSSASSNETILHEWSFDGSQENDNDNDNLYNIKRYHWTAKQKALNKIK